MRMFDVEILVEDGLIRIKQPGAPESNVDDVVEITADQVDVVCEWLERAKNEIREGQK